jgi:hypothetical protein
MVDLPALLDSAERRRQWEAIRRYWKLTDEDVSSYDQARLRPPVPKNLTPDGAAFARVFGWHSGWYSQGLLLDAGAETPQSVGLRPSVDAAQRLFQLIEPE